MTLSLGVKFSVGGSGRIIKIMANKIHDNVNCYGAFKEYCCYNEKLGLIKWRQYKATSRQILILCFVSSFYSPYV
jgi:hypothetical protein